MTQLTAKPLSFFKINPQVRKCFDEADLRRLGESMKVKQLQPVLAQPDGTLIAGERRFRAAKLVGLATLEVIITEKPLSETEIRLIQLAENMHRADLKPIEQVDGLEELARLNHGMTNKELAELVHLDPSMVTRLRSVSKVMPSVREALASGALGLSTAYAISKCESPADQERMLAQALSGASRDAIEQAGRNSRNRKATTVTTKRVKIAMPQGASVVLSGTALGMAEVVDLLTETLKEARKAVDQYDVRTWQSMMKDKAKGGGKHD
jgi:ParB family transcriptional regulator, chromosome partitioning protein